MVPVQLSHPGRGCFTPRELVDGHGLRQEPFPHRIRRILSPPAHRRSALSLFTTNISSSPVPWQLYIKSRPRTRLPDASPSLASPDDDSARLAASELRSSELFFLILTLLTPLIGAFFLRYTTTFILGANSFSWFNTALFTLAAGFRPWSHLVHRIQQRTTELHNAIHYPSPDLISAAADGDAYSKIETLEARVAHLESAMVKMKARVADATQELYEYVDEAVDSVDRSVKRQGQRCERQEARMRDVVEGLQSTKQARSLPAPLNNTTSTTAAPSHTLLLSRLITPQAWFAPEPKPKKRRAPPLVVNCMRPSSSSESTTVQLESVPEEDEAEDATVPAARKLHQMWWPCSATLWVLSGIGYMFTLPLKVAIKLVLGR